MSSSADKNVFVLVEEDDGHDDELELIYGTNQSDVINAGGGPQHIMAGNGEHALLVAEKPD